MRTVMGYCKLVGWFQVSSGLVTVKGTKMMMMVMMNMMRRKREK